MDGNMNRLSGSSPSITEESVDNCPADSTDAAEPPDAGRSAGGFHRPKRSGREPAGEKGDAHDPAAVNSAADVPKADRLDSGKLATTERHFTKTTRQSFVSNGSAVIKEAIASRDRGHWDRRQSREANLQSGGLGAETRGADVNEVVGTGDAENSRNSVAARPSNCFEKKKFVDSAPFTDAANKNQAASSSVHHKAGVYILLRTPYFPPIAVR